MCGRLRNHKGGSNTKISNRGEQLTLRLKIEGERMTY